MMRKLLLLGSGGQLGKSLSNLFKSDDLAKSYDLISLNHADLDVTSNESVMAVINDICPDMVINATAYTAVDNAEDDKTTCYAVNAVAPEYIAKACAAIDAKLLHISTDYVYNGEIKKLHDEAEMPLPGGIYAMSKLEGEQRAMQYCTNTIIIRTSWLYSPYGKNFVKTIGNLSFIKPELRVVSDQFGNPTYALDLAKAIITIIKSERWISGIFNYSNSGPISWYEFAREIVSLLGNSDKCIVYPIDSTQYPAKAKRPKFSALNCDKIKRIYGIGQEPWQESLARMVAEYRDCFDSVSNNH